MPADDDVLAMSEAEALETAAWYASIPYDGVTLEAPQTLVMEVE